MEEADRMTTDAWAANVADLLRQRKKANADLAKALRRLVRAREVMNRAELIVVDALDGRRAALAAIEAAARDSTGPSGTP